MKKKTVSSLINLVIFYFLFQASFKACAQEITVVRKAFSGYNASVGAMFDISLFNSGPEAEVVVHGKLLNSDAIVLIDASTAPLIMKQGSHSLSELGAQIESQDYSTSDLSEFIRSRHILPNGIFILCYTITSKNSESILVEVCDEIESEQVDELVLVSPYDESEIDTKTPLLVWNHTEPFEILGESDYFNLTLTEVKEGQNAESALQSNIHLLSLDHLISHQILYPIDGTELQEGKTYSWMVQKISRGKVVQRTEAWKFKIITITPQPDIKYYTLSKLLNSGYYSAVNKKLFVRFDEPHDNASVVIRIRDEISQDVSVEAKNEKSEISKSNVLYRGYNRFELDLAPFKLRKEVIYTLEVITQFKEIYLLKFKID